MLLQFIKPFLPIACEALKKGKWQKQRLAHFSAKQAANDGGDK